MTTNKIIHIGKRNTIQAISFLSVKLLWFKMAKIPYVEIIPGQNLTKNEIIDILCTNKKFNHLVESVVSCTTTVYVVLK